MVDAKYILAFWLKNLLPYAFQFCLLLLATNILQNLTLFISQAISAKGKIKQYTLWGTIIGITPLILSSLCFSVGLPPYYMYFTMILSAIGRIILDLYFGQKLCNINCWIFFKEVILKLLICLILSCSIGYLVQIIMQPSFFSFYFNCFHVYYNL